MATIKPSDLVPGTVTATEYRSTTGELLIARGFAVTAQHIEALNRRGITELVAKPDSIHDEIDSLLSKRFAPLGTIDLDETARQPSPEAVAPEAPSPASLIPSLCAIAAGRAGMEQLLATDPVIRAEQCAVSSPRTHREAFTAYHGMEMLVKMARQGLVHGPFVKSFLEYNSLFPVGSYVELNDGRVGRVVAVNGASYTKPVISIMADAFGRKPSTDAPYILDLKMNPDIQIARALRHDALGPVDIVAGM